MYCSCIHDLYALFTRETQSEKDLLAITYAHHWINDFVCFILGIRDRLLFQYELDSNLGALWKN